MAREATPGVSRVPEVSIPVGGRCYSADASTHQTTPDAQPERRTCPTVSTYNLLADLLQAANSVANISGTYGCDEFVIEVLPIQSARPSVASHRAVVHS